MKKNISINIGGIIFHIEEDGYEKLKNYLDSVNSYFSTFEDSKEIIEDIEGRIAEIFLARLDEGKQVISQVDVDELINIMGTTKDFDAAIETEPEEEPAKETTEEEPKAEKKETTDKKLFRDSKRKVIGGVASGLAHFFGIDPIWVRLLFLAFLFNIVFWGLSTFIFVAYIVLWIAIPASDKLDDDKAVKKLYRDSEDRVLGGVSSGIAQYFGVDTIIIRVLFVVSIFLGGAGLVAYIILWIITPEAKTITEKMQMQGEPVTISNIEENVKKSLNVREGEENVFVKILLFPFRLIAIIFKALGELLGPLLKFAVEALRILVGVFLVFLGFVMMICFTMAFFVLLGLGGSMEHLIQFGTLPADYLIGSLSTVTIISSYLVTMVPSLAIALGGLSIITRKMVTRPFVGWSMFGLWLLGLIGLAFSVPTFIRDFSTENSYIEERTFKVTDETPTLYLNEIDYGFGYEGVELKLRGHSDSTYLLKLDFESRGATRSAARENASAVDYFVEQRNGDFYFDNELSFDNDTPFRLQRLEATFFIPYGQVFRMEDELADILRNTLYLRGYRSWQMEDNDWVFDQGGIRCLTCDENEDSSFKYERRGGSRSQSYEFTNFDELRIISLFDFDIRQGDSYRIELQGDEDALDNIALIQHGDELEIKSREDWKWWREEHWDKVKIYIEMPELEYLFVRGACEGDVRGFDNEEITFKVEGASEVWADIETEYTYVDIAGASELTLVGKSENMEADIIGASELSAFSFEVEDVDVRAVGGSTVRVYASNDLEADAIGASSIRYRGNPRVSSDSKGLSSIRKD